VERAHCQDSFVLCKMASSSRTTWVSVPARRLQARFAFAGGRKHQIRLEKGEQVEVMRMTSDGAWCEGINLQSGAKGIFPANFMEEEQGFVVLPDGRNGSLFREIVQMLDGLRASNPLEGSEDEKKIRELETWKKLLFPDGNEGCLRNSQAEALRAVIRCRVTGESIRFKNEMNLLRLLFLFRGSTLLTGSPKKIASRILGDFVLNERDVENEPTFFDLSFSLGEFEGSMEVSLHERDGERLTESITCSSSSRNGWFVRLPKHELISGQVFVVGRQFRFGPLLSHGKHGFCKRFTKALAWKLEMNEVLQKCHVVGFRSETVSDDAPSQIVARILQKQKKLSSDRALNLQIKAYEHKQNRLESISAGRPIRIDSNWPDTIERDDLFLSIVRGQFNQDSKRSQRNVEIRVAMIDNGGSIVFQRDGPYLGRTCVQYHKNAPQFDEFLKVDLRRGMSCHLFFALFHVSSNAGMSMPFGFAFLPLSPEMLERKASLFLQCFDLLPGMDSIADELTLVSLPQAEKYCRFQALKRGIDSIEAASPHLRRNDVIEIRLKQVSNKAKAEDEFPEPVVFGGFVRKLIQRIEEAARDDAMLLEFDRLCNYLVNVHQTLGSWRMLRRLDLLSFHGVISFTSLRGCVRLRLEQISQGIDLDIAEGILDAFPWVSMILLSSPESGKHVWNLLFIVEAICKSENIALADRALRASGDLVLMAPKISADSEIRQKIVLEAVRSLIENASNCSKKNMARFVKQVCRSAIFNEYSSRQALFPALMNVFAACLVPGDAPCLQECAEILFDLHLLETSTADDIWNEASALPACCNLVQSYTAWDATNGTISFSHADPVCEVKSLKEVILWTLSLVPRLTGRQKDHFVATLHEEDRIQFARGLLFLCSGVLSMPEEWLVPPNWVEVKRAIVDCISETLKWTCDFFRREEFKARDIALVLHATLVLDLDSVFQGIWKKMTKEQRRQLPCSLAVQLLGHMRSKEFAQLLDERAIDQEFRVETTRFVDEVVRREGDNSQMEAFLTSVRNQITKSEGKRFIEEITNFRKLLRDVERLERINENEIRICETTRDLLEFLQQIDMHRTTFKKHAEDLADFHKSLGNFEEAIECLRLLPDAQSNNLEIASIFEEGGFFRESIECLDRVVHFLKPQHRFMEIASIMQKQATLFERISEEDRVMAKSPSFPFFRVYTSEGLFIYKGDRFQTHAEFAAGLGGDFDVQRVQRSAQRDTFVAISSFRKSSRKGGNDAMETWAKQIFLKVERGGFPSFCRRLKVVKEWEVHLDPLRIAFESIREKNEELHEAILINKQLTTRSASQKFTMLLSGVLDAAVSGGVFKNYSSFLDGTYRAKYPEILENFQSLEECDTWIRRLKELILEQEILLQEALYIHKNVCAESLLPLHEHLESKQKTKK